MNQTSKPLEIDTASAETVAFVSSRVDDRQTNWTELGVYYVPNADGRCFLAQAIGRTTIRGQTQRKREVYVGSLQRALDSFDASELADSIQLQAEDWLERNPGRVEADVKQLREVERRPAAAPIGFTGEGGMIGALQWLYGADLSPGALSAHLDRDFGVPGRTVRHALKQEADGVALTGWAKAFVSALLFFDRGQFKACAPKGGA